MYWNKRLIVDKNDIMHIFFKEHVLIIRVLYLSFRWDSCNHNSNNCRSPCQNGDFMGPQEFDLFVISAHFENSKRPCTLKLVLEKRWKKSCLFRCELLE